MAITAATAKIDATLFMNTSKSRDIVKPLVRDSVGEDRFSVMRWRVGSGFSVPASCLMLYEVEGDAITGCLAEQDISLVILCFLSISREASTRQLARPVSTAAISRCGENADAFLKQCESASGTDSALNSHSGTNATTHKRG